MNMYNCKRAQWNYAIILFLAANLAFHASACDGDDSGTIAQDDEAIMDGLSSGFIPALLAIELEDAFLSGDVDTLETLLSDDYIDNTAASQALFAPPQTGVEALVSDALAVSGGFPDAERVVESIAVKRGRVHVQSAVSARHLGDYAGFPAT